MAEIKTKSTSKPVEEFLQGIEPEEKRRDGLALLKIFSDVTGEKAVMWGESIVGFGLYHYKSERSSQEGDWPLVGFSPRKQNLTLYISAGNESSEELFSKLGAHKRSIGCVYIKRLSDVDVDVLRKLILKSYRFKR